MKIESKNSPNTGIEIDVEPGTATAYLLQILEDRTGLIWQALEWIRDGWEVYEAVEISPTMIIAALEKYYYDCLQDPDSTKYWTRTVGNAVRSLINTEQIRLSVRIGMDEVADGPILSE